MQLLDDIARAFFDALYELRVAGRDRLDRRGARGRPHRPEAGLVRGRSTASRVGRASSSPWQSPSELPLTWYLASPIFIRTALVEPAPVIAVGDRRPDHDPDHGARRHRTLLRSLRARRRRPRPTANAVPAGHPGQRRVPRLRRLPFRARAPPRSSRRRRAATTSASRTSPSATVRTCSSTCRRTPTAMPRERSSSAS